jgi:hypothetical protein
MVPAAGFVQLMHQLLLGPVQSRPEVLRLGRSDPHLAPGERKLYFHHLAMVVRLENHLGALRPMKLLGHPLHELLGTFPEILG